MSLEMFADLYRKNGFEVIVEKDKLSMSHNGVEFYTPIEDFWLKSINTFFKAKQFEFDSATRMLTSNRCVEFQAVRLDAAFLPRPDHEYSDERGNKVKVSMATPEFALSLLTSDASEKIFELVARRVHLRASHHNAFKAIL